MGKTIVFVNQKGGVGKTTSAINIGAYLALAGKRVLLIDFDPQANLSSGVGIKSGSKGIYEVISGQAKLSDVVQKTVVDRMWIAPASIDLSGATVELVDKSDLNYYLKKAIEPEKANWDYVLIDCPPSLGVLTLNGLCAADEVFIPMQCEYFALEGLMLIVKTIQMVQKNLNPSLAVGGIFFTMFDSRTKLANDVVAQVSEYFKGRVFKSIIPRNIRLAEAPSNGVPVCAYEPECAGAKSYFNLANEVIARG